MPELYTYWAYGNQRDTAEFVSSLHAKIQSTFNAQPNIIKIECDSTDKDSAKSSDIVKLLRMRDLFDTRPRVIQLYGIPEDYTLLTDYLHLTNQNNILLILSQPGYRSGYGRWNPIQVSKLYKTVKDKGVIRDFGLEAKTSADASAWVVKIFKLFNKNIDSESLDKFVYFCGLNYDRLETEAKKLCTYQSAKKITIEDVVNCCANERNETVWNFIDFLDYGKYDEALEYLEKFFLEHSGTGLYGQVSMLLAAIMQHFTFILFVKDSDGTSEQNIKDSVSGWKKLTPTQISELKSGELKQEDIEDYFKPNFISFNMYKPGVKSALKWKKSKIYGVMESLDRCILVARMNSNNETNIKFVLSCFIMLVCEKLTLEQYRIIVPLFSDRLNKHG